MRYEFTFINFLSRLVPHHKRIQANRIFLFWWPLGEIYNLWISFKAWRDEQTYRAKLVAQTLVLEGVLNSEVENSNNNISIVQSSDSGLFLGLLSENTDYAYLSTASENSDLKEVPLYGEGSTALAVNFRVYAPAACDADNIKSIVEQYILAGYSFEVIQS